MAKVKMNTDETLETVSEVAVEEEPKKTKETKTVKVTNCERLRLRAAASTSSDVITLISEGTVLTVLNRVDNNWTRVRLEDGKTGFVMNKFIK